MVDLIADELVKLAELRKQGVLTDAEFQERKSKLLDRKASSATPTGLKALFGCLGALLVAIFLSLLPVMLNGECARTSNATAAADSASQAAEAAAKEVSKPQRKY